MLGILCGVVFGEYCAFLQVVGRAYVGLLQMTVLPYLVLSLIGKMGRLEMIQARQLGVAVFVTLLVLWLIGVLLIVCATLMLPSIPGATFFSPAEQQDPSAETDLILTFVPANIFYSLSSEYIPGVVIFCLFFGVALIHLPGKEPVLGFLDVCIDAIGRINVFLVRLAPFGLFALSAAAAGTMRLEELSRLQAYLIMFTLLCLVSAFGILPWLVSSLTRTGYRELLRAAQEPVLTAIATGKLFVVLPQIVERCEALFQQDDDSLTELEESAAHVVVPLAYSFPHLGKVMAFIFISFAAWYVGRELTPMENASMAATGVVSSFASPLVSIPYFLDRYQLPQDLVPLFILPGFITTRLADVVGVFHLMALTLIVGSALHGRLRIQWRRLMAGLTVICVVSATAGLLGRWYLTTTSLDYDLDDRLLSLKVPSAYEEVTVYRSRAEVSARVGIQGSTLDRVRASKVVRVGYHEDCLPYTFFNRQQQLVGLDVELMHRLAADLQVRLEFVPYRYDTVLDQLDEGQLDLAVGGLIMTPERLLKAEFTQSYETATVAVALLDHRRFEFDMWDDPQMLEGFRLGVVQRDLAVAARRKLSQVTIVDIDSAKDFFDGNRFELDGLLIAAEAGAAWNVLYPEHAIVVPTPIVQRPVGMAAAPGESDWVRFLDRWLEFHRLDGTFDRLHAYWVEGGGTVEVEPRWCVIRNVLHWVP
jgi:Na+/H+-dicarboxylate symporter/ABC-type amino acid transport substrate-binding protein